MEKMYLLMVTVTLYEYILLIYVLACMCFSISHLFPFLRRKDNEALMSTALWRLHPSHRGAL